jgi:regulator of replication initiation timing
MFEFFSSLYMMNCELVSLKNENEKLKTEIEKLKKENNVLTNSNINLRAKISALKCTLRKFHISFAI